MKKNEMIQAYLLRIVKHFGRVGVSLFVLSMILGILPPTLTAFASTHMFASRVQIDANVRSFIPFNNNQAMVLDRNNKLWLESPPFG